MERRLLAQRHHRLGGSRWGDAVMFPDHHGHRHRAPRQDGGAVAPVAQPDQGGDDRLVAGRLDHLPNPGMDHRPGVGPEKHRCHLDGELRPTPVEQPGYGGVPPRLALRSVGGRLGVDQRHRPQPPGVALGEGEGDVAAHGQPHQVDPVDIEGVEQPGEVVGVALHAERSGDHRRRAPEAGQVGDDAAALFPAEPIDLLGPHRPVEREPVDEQRHGPRTGVGVVQRDPADDCQRHLNPPVREARRRT